MVKEQKKPGVPPAFQIDRHLQKDIRAEYGYFLNIATDLNQLFNRGEIEGTEEQRRRWIRRLKRLEKKFRGLNIPTDL
ncbi:hypothetical protein AKJ51_02390 [candidate division MSBL1 archaeon SCGC-AAA382A20]|uniref:Uncharacterized protein n=1 Tax=candidate division MSBL1 archaeon SCGC-AAA382A20 TaxID=1698280 RepID=A0A133VKK3_9EURY|nr:hypothetical protein AKJ51_02390 [candidate division MSBL1 archaeon SCGC-AAA382A20]